MAEQFYVYIMTNAPRGTLYIGMTNDLVRRVYEHREGLAKGFTSKYKLKILVYFEVHSDPATAHHRERRLKNWNRAWKVELIEQGNPTWLDLWPEIAKS